MIKILLALPIFFGCFTGAWAASPQLEEEFVKIAPQVMDLFKQTKNTDDRKDLAEELHYLQQSESNVRSKAQINFMEVLLSSPCGGGNSDQNRLTLEAYAGSVVPPSIAEYRLTPVAAASVISYTTEDYRSINVELRKSKPSQAALVYAEMVNAALDKLPEFVGMVKRGVELPGSVLQTFYVGNVIEFKAFTSTTSYMELSDFELGHRLIIHSKHGRDISKLSGSGHEAEVLFKAGTKFRVVAASTNVNLGGNIASLEYELEEIE